MDGFPSGQRGQTVNLLATPSKVRILLHPLPLNRCGQIVAQRKYADVAQLAEQLICNQQVIGSSPIIGFVSKGTSQINIISRGGAVWKLVGLITRRSQVQILLPQLTHLCVLNAQIAQLVEQRTENPRVAGSIPALGIILWLKLVRIYNNRGV